MPPSPPEFAVLGAGVIGLTTAMALRERFPAAAITVVAKHLPGATSATEYTSPWAGAIMGFDRDFNPTSEFHRVSFVKFSEIARAAPESGVAAMRLRMVYDDEAAGGGERWFAGLVGGTRRVPGEELPAGFAFGLEFVTLVINTIVYLGWLQNELLRAQVRFDRRRYGHIDAFMQDYPMATAIFNCTGLGARHLGGVEDTDVYPTKGQTILVAEPKGRLESMYIAQSSKWPKGEMAHVFPRPLGGGVIIGGIRKENEWSGEPDMELAERIKERSCLLAPELGKPGELQVISHNVGLRPTRKGGPRLEFEKRNGRLLVHSYGAGGGGYEGSWGMAYHAVELLEREL